MHDPQLTSFILNPFQPHMNGLSHSPQQLQQQQQQQMLPPQQKPSQMPNGIRLDAKKLDSDRLFPFGTKSLQEPLTNGNRRHPYPDRPIDKIVDSNDKNLDSNDRHFMHSNSKNSMAPPMSTNVPNSSSLFPKPFKVPVHQDKAHPVPRPITNHIEPITPSVETGDNVESILKLMTAPLGVAPLEEIAATPRTELEVQHSNKKHVYAMPGLPTMSRAFLNQRKSISVIYSFFSSSHFFSVMF